ncbi:Npt1/Npt2 family nucleotide transporter [Candidatus Rhabdochlamydia sp. T3358]|uniref:Npt1/Npt2 family nucleotide transporter n=1 Tax=Candidatus Rhabdochlamydia sp. T3358 TaxID=2099795 RepID=UPI0010B27883|nr:Npt1/Npt2 family nucleotide transporter [Candidatus Rhabdochlamydia sp. T3358]VHO03135.1 TLC ATP/ADP transporter [Candidatus Rhabdochlamydia sp. T3358]
MLKRSKEHLFILTAMLCSFFISMDYAIVRPVSNALFITDYGVNFFPYAWLLSIPLNLLLVGLYNKYLPKLGCLKTYLILAIAVICINCTCAIWIHKVPFLSFFLYIWKDAYIMLIFQQVWSLIHINVSMERAKYLYGFFFGIGGLGSLLGSLFPSFLAVKIGSESLLYITLPLYVFLSLLYVVMLKQSKQADFFPLEKKQGLETVLHGLKLIASSRVLIFISLAVVFMQVISTLVDYQFNTFLEGLVTEKDLRTQYSGRIQTIGQTFTTAMQFLGTYFLVRFFGVKRLHVGIPMLLCIMSIFCFLFPAFGMITLTFVILKTFDFSLFSIIKEMLYIPLNSDQKFRAKAFIDVFLYRFAKAFASLIILSLQAVLSTSLLPVLNATIVFIFTIWIAVAMYQLKETDLSYSMGSVK